MGKITSMHFAGWKLGLKTGMYYLRTMAASAPIQFTVDQEALLVADTNVARERTTKKRSMPSSGYIASSSSTNGAGPRPMYAKQTSQNKSSSISAPNGVPTPSTTPPPSVAAAAKEAHTPIAKVPFKADIEEGGSPKALATEPVGEPKEEELEVKAKQVEDEGQGSEEREYDIYADAKLQCKFTFDSFLNALILMTITGSIDNKEECMMCSG